MIRVSIALLLAVFSHGIAHGQTPQKLVENAKLNFEKGEYNEALGFLNQAIEIDSFSLDNYMLRARTFYSLEQYYNTILDINTILEIDGIPREKQFDCFLTRGKAFLAVDDYTNSKKDLENCMAIRKDNDEVYYYKALLGLETLNNYDAMEAINEAIKYDAGIPDYYALRAKIKISFTNPVPNSEAYQSIMSDINVAIALAPESHEYFLIRSDFLNSMGDFDAALNDYNTVIKLSPKKEEAYTERGVIKMNNYDYRSAALDFTKSIIINPEDERNYRFRGLCYNNLNNFADAFKDFTRSIDLLNLELGSTSSKELIQSKLGETYLLRGHCLNLMGNNAQACRDFLFAHNLGIKKGLNYYRKFCGIY